MPAEARIEEAIISGFSALLATTSKPAQITTHHGCRYVVPLKTLSLLIACITPADSIPMALDQRETRLPCQHYLRRLGRAAEIDKDEILACD
jgi:hypothetical protein